MKLNAVDGREVAELLDDVADLDSVGHALVSMLRLESRIPIPSPVNQRQHDVRRHAYREATIGVVHTETKLERLDVALRAADVALGRVARVDAAVEHRALALVAGGKPDRQRVSHANAIDVGLFDIDSHPQVVRIDERDDRLPRRDDLAGQRRANIDDAANRRVNLGIGQAHIGLRLLRCRGGLLLPICLQLIPPDRDLLGLGLGQRDGCA